MGQINKEKINSVAWYLLVILISLFSYDFIWQSLNQFYYLFIQDSKNNTGVIISKSENDTYEGYSTAIKYKYSVNDKLYLSGKTTLQNSSDTTLDVNDSITIIYSKKNPAVSVPVSNRGFLIPFSFIGILLVGVCFFSIFKLVQMIFLKIKN